MNPKCPNCKSNDNVVYDQRDHSYWCYECDATFKYKKELEK